MQKSLRLIFVLLVLLLGCSTVGTGKGGGLVVNSNFENGKVTPWTGRGDSRVEIAANVVFKGKYSLLSTGRDQADDGPVLDLTGKMLKGREYKISGWVQLAADSAVCDMKMSVERTLKGVVRIDKIAGPIKGASGVWISLDAIYPVISDVEKIKISFEVSLPGSSFYIDNVTVTEIGKIDLAAAEKKIEKDIPSIREVYKDYFPIGAAVEPSQFFGEEGELLKKHFSSITAENVMKPEAIQPKEGVFSFQAADLLVDFAIANNMVIRGHCLVWHRALPPWFFVDSTGKKVTREVLLARIENHIKTLVGRYKGKIYAWDVVNEANEQYAANGYRETEWYKIIGPDYIEKVFQYAHEADPAAKLFLNDYEVENLQKGEKVYALAKELKEKGVPIHGIGMQFHISIVKPGIEAIASTIEKFRALGLEIHITELDMTLYQSEQQPGFEQIPNELLVRQGHRYKEIFDVFKANKDIVRNVTFWGYHDDHTWMTQDVGARINAPLIFDRSLKAKPAFWGIVDPKKLPPDVILKVTQKEPDTAQAKRGTPVIDAEEDAVWATTETIYTEIFIIRSSGAKASARVLWDDTNLYIYAFIKDANVRKASSNAWEQDSFEVFIDENNHKSIDFEADDAQYRVNFKNEQTFGGSPNKMVSATKIVPDGYIVELSIAFKTIKPVNGTRIGFDLQVNDDQGSGARDSAVKWNDPTNEGYRNTSGFGILTLVE